MQPVFTAHGTRWLGSVAVAGSATRQAPLQDRQDRQRCKIGSATRQAPPQWTAKPGAPPLVQAVAVGAAIRAAMLEGQLSDFMVLDVWQASLMRAFAGKVRNWLKIAMTGVALVPFVYPPVSRRAHGRLPHSEKYAQSGFLLRCAGGARAGCRSRGSSRAGCARCRAWRRSRGCQRRGSGRRCSVSGPIRRGDRCTACC
jgi:hypothetical protein